MGLIADIAWQCQREGYSVKLHTVNPEYRDIGLGLIPLSDDFKKDTRWADVVVFDDVLGLGEKADWVRSQGKLVVGGTPYTDKLEDDRGFGHLELERHGVRTLPCQSFDDFDSGIDFVRKHPESYVIKPCGEAANNKKMLFVGDNPAGLDVIEVLSHYKATELGKRFDYQLQKRVFGVEAAIQGFFDGEKFLTPYSISFEHKRFFTGDLGPQTGEMGTSMFWIPSCYFSKNTIEKFAPTLAKEGYCGSFDVNCIVNEDGIHPLEFTCRFGFPQIHIQQEGMAEPIGDILCEMPTKLRSSFKTKPGFQVGVQIRVPPYPYDDSVCWERLSKEIPIEIPNKDYQGIHPQDIKVIDERWVLAGSDGCPLVVCGSGLTLRDAQEQAYSRVKELKIPNCYYRTDIGNRWYERSEGDKLLIWGILS